MTKPSATVFYNQPNKLLYRLYFYYSQKLRDYPIDTWLAEYVEICPEEIVVDSKPVVLCWKRIGGSFYVENVEYSDPKVRLHAHAWIQDLINYVTEKLTDAKSPLAKQSLTYRWSLVRYDQLPSSVGSGLFNT